MTKDGFYRIPICAMFGSLPDLLEENTQSSRPCSRGWKANDSVLQLCETIFCPPVGRYAARSSIRRPRTLEAGGWKPRIPALSLRAPDMFRGSEFSAKAHHPVAAIPAGSVIDKAVRQKVSTWKPVTEVRAAPREFLELLYGISSP